MMKVEDTDEAALRLFLTPFFLKEGVLGEEKIRQLFPEEHKQKWNSLLDKFLVSNCVELGTVFAMKTIPPNSHKLAGDENYHKFRSFVLKFLEEMTKGDKFSFAQGELLLAIKNVNLKVEKVTLGAVLKEFCRPHGKNWLIKSEDSTF